MGKYNPGVIPQGYISCQQDNWVDFLSLAEFAYNNSMSTTTKLTPFSGRYGYNLQFDVMDKKLPLLPVSLEISKFKEKLEKLEQHLRQEIHLAQETCPEYANNNRIPPLTFTISSSV